MSTNTNADNLRQAWLRLSQDRRPDGRGSIYALTSPVSATGTSYVARNMALIAAQQMSIGKQVLIVDMDIQSNEQANWFSSAQSHYGIPEGPYDACFGTVPFWRVTPSMVDDNGQNLTDSHFMSLHVVNAANIAFTKFHWEQFRQGQSVHIQNARGYWHKLREHFGAIIVDTPALDRADIITTICPEADSTILVSATKDANAKPLGDAFTRIKVMNGRCAGVILNDAPVRQTDYEGSA